MDIEEKAERILNGGSPDEVLNEDEDFTGREVRTTNEEILRGSGDKVVEDDIYEVLEKYGVDVDSGSIYLTQLGGMAGFRPGNFPEDIDTENLTDELKSLTLGDSLKAWIDDDGGLLVSNAQQF